MEEQSSQAASRMDIDWSAQSDGMDIGGHGDAGMDLEVETVNESDEGMEMSIQDQREDMDVESGDKQKTPNKDPIRKNTVIVIDDLDTFLAQPSAESNAHDDDGVSSMGTPVNTAVNYPGLHYRQIRRDSFGTVTHSDDGDASIL